MLNDLSDYFFNGLLHHDLLPRRCRDHRVRGWFDEFNQIGVDDYRFAMKPG